MPRESNPQLSNAHEQEVSAASAPAGSTPEAEVTPTVPNFRKDFMKDSQFEVLMGMGEGEYRQMMASLLEDLQLGLESHRVEQMGETFWRMRRSQRIRDGLALKNIKVPGEDMAATVRSSQAFGAMEPFERLHKALSRPGQGPTAAEISHLLWHGHLGRDRSRAGRPWHFQMHHTHRGVCGKPQERTSPAMQEFITLLKSLNQPMEEKERKAARSVVARTCLVGPRVFRPEQGKAADLQDRSALPAGTLRDSRHAVCSPVRRNSIGGESGRADGSGGSEVHASTEVRGLQRAPAVAPDQRFGEGPAGGTREKRC